LIAKRAFARDQLEILVKAGEIVKPALIAQLFDTEIIFYQQLAGVPHSYLDEEAGVGLPGPGFEKSAEGMGADICHRGNLFQLDRSFEVLQAVFIYSVDPLIFRLLEIMPEADGGKRVCLLGCGDDRQGFH
jgi:hypothetical protein